MALIKYEILDSRNKEDVIEYEKGLYRAFTTKNPASEHIKNWELVGNDRYRSKLPYQDLTIYLIRVEDKIAGGAAINFNPEHKFEVENFGFTLSPQIRNMKIADGLSLYILEEYIDTNFMAVFNDLCDFILLDLKKKKIDYWYGNSIKKTKALYILMGFEVVDNMGDDKYLIRYDIKNL